MENVSSIQNSYPQHLSPELQKRLNSTDNFAALDSEKLKQDSIDFVNKTKENANENWLVRKMKNFGIEDPKKLFKSILLTAATVIGIATLGNKLSTPTAKLGEKVDDIFLDQKNFLGKIYNSCSNFAKKVKDGITKIPRTKSMQDIEQTVKQRPAKIKCQMGRGYERGPVGIFIMTVNESLDKTKNLGQKAFRKILGDKEATKLLNDLATGEHLKDPQQYYPKLTEKIVNYARGNFPQAQGKTDMQILELMRNNKIKGVDLTEFTQIHMTGGPFGGWWPVNIVNKIGSKIGQTLTGNKSYNMNFCQGNLFDSLIKFNAVNSTGAKTVPGRFVQKITTIPTECISNFVNDKSGFGFFLAKGIIDTYNNVQDAPKEKRASTIGNEFTSQVLGWVVTMPIAYKILYTGIGSMKNLAGSTILTKALKQVGKFFGMGLDFYKKDGGNWSFVKNNNKITGFAGGAMRFIGLMFVINPIISKQISKITNKIFGKPYNKAEEQQKLQYEAQMKQVIPELGITQGELIEKMQKNPQIVNQIQQNPNIVAQIETNPKLLLDLLDGKPISQTNNTKPIQNQTPMSTNSYTISPMNRDFITRRKNSINPPKQNKTAPNTAPNAVSNAVSNAAPKNTAPKNTTSTNTIQTPKQDKKTEAKKRDTATYIPSSAAAPTPLSTLSNEQLIEYNSQMTRADKLLQAAEKYI